MTRRDIIILAVLVNAGLLAVLFLLAINSDDDKFSGSNEVTQTTVAMQVNETYPKEITDPGRGSEPVGDEVDHVLREFADTPSFQTIVEEELPSYAGLDNDDTQ